MSVMSTHRPAADAVSHSDGICLNSTVWLDGQCIMREGVIVDKELSALDPTV